MKICNEINGTFILWVIRTLCSWRMQALHLTFGWEQSEHFIYPSSWPQLAHFSCSMGGALWRMISSNMVSRLSKKCCFALYWFEVHQQRKYMSLGTRTFNLSVLESTALFSSSSAFFIISSSPHNFSDSRSKDVGLEARSSCERTFVPLQSKITQSSSIIISWQNTSSYVHIVQRIRHVSPPFSGCLIRSAFVEY